MNRNFFKNKLFIVLVFIGIYLVGFMFSALLGSAKMPHEQFVGFVMTPFNTAGTAVKNFFSDMFSAPFRYDDLEKENEDLRGQLAQARAEADENAYLKIENGIIEDAKFKTFGCGAAVATSSMATEMVIGKTVQEALEVTNVAVMEALDGLPPVKVHCSLLAEEAIHAALWDYAEKNGIKIEGLEKPKTDISEGEEEEEY